MGLDEWKHMLLTALKAIFHLLELSQLLNLGISGIDFSGCAIGSDGGTSMIFLLAQ